MSKRIKGLIILLTYILLLMLFFYGLNLLFNQDNRIGGILTIFSGSILCIHWLRNDTLNYKIAKEQKNTSEVGRTQYYFAKSIALSIFLIGTIIYVIYRWSELVW